MSGWVSKRVGGIWTPSVAPMWSYQIVSLFGSIKSDTGVGKAELLFGGGAFLRHGRIVAGRPLEKIEITQPSEGAY